MHICRLPKIIFCMELSKFFLEGSTQKIKWRASLKTLLLATTTTAAWFFFFSYPITLFGAARQNQDIHSSLQRKEQTRAWVPSDATAPAAAAVYCFYHFCIILGGNRRHHHSNPGFWSRFFIWFLVMVVNWALKSVWKFPEKSHF